jgi:hypothetical protein
MAPSNSGNTATPVVDQPNLAPVSEDIVIDRKVAEREGFES